MRLKGAWAELYLIPLRRQKIADKLSDLYYFSLNAEKQLEAIKIVYKEYETDKDVVALVENIVEYFEWCRDVRNKLLHAEHYPPMFGGDPDTLQLTKREGKKPPKQVYVALQLNRLRGLADQIAEGKMRCASLRIYLRVRELRPTGLPYRLKLYENEPLPEKLVVPPSLELFPHPPTHGSPARLRKPFRA